MKNNCWESAMLKSEMNPRWRPPQHWPWPPMPYSCWRPPMPSDQPASPIACPRPNGDVIKKNPAPLPRILLATCVLNCGVRASGNLISPTSCTSISRTQSRRIICHTCLRLSSMPLIHDKQEYLMLLLPSKKPNPRGGLESLLHSFYAIYSWAFGLCLSKVCG